MLTGFNQKVGSRLPHPFIGAHGYTTVGVEAET